MKKGPRLQSQAALGGNHVILAKSLFKASVPRLKWRWFTCHPEVSTE